MENMKRKCIAKEETNVGYIQRTWCLFLMVFTLSMLTCLSACGGENEQPESGPQRGFDIETAAFKCRDPFIYWHEQTKRYYLHVNGGGKISCYTSSDLQWWRYECDSFVPRYNFWGKEDFWAPDLYEYKDRYYLFVTFSAPDAKRGTSILVADHPAGPFEPLVNGPITPKDQMCLDGSLYIDEQGTPWMLYCREWLEAVDGEIYAVQLTDDLKARKGDPQLLFRASAAPWVGDITAQGVTGKVTDAPFVMRDEQTGRLYMTWSSFRRSNGAYAIGVAYSEGDITGPWKHKSTQIVSGGGHAMLFKTKAGRMMISYHAPNTSPSYLTLRKAYFYQNELLIE